MPDEEGPHIEVQVPPELMAGVYANAAAVSSQTPHDFTIDFMQVLPGSPDAAPTAVVVARIKVAQSFLMPLMQALAHHQIKVEDMMRQLREQQDEGEEG